MARSTSLITRGTDGDGNPCVFKQLRPENVGRDDLMLRLQNEAAVLAHLAGVAGIIRLVAVRTAPFALVLELADGGSLEERLQATMPPMERIRVARDLVAAVAACHGRGVTHRDVKPSNVLFVGDAVRLADFGVAAWGDPARAVPEGWEEDEVGTRPWSAPELRAHATTVVSTAVDAYGLGMVLTTLLGDAASETVVAARRDDPVRRPSIEEIARSLR